jgi:hypothetical protein
MASWRGSWPQGRGEAVRKLRGLGLTKHKNMHVGGSKAAHLCNTSACGYSGWLATQHRSTPQRHTLSSCCRVRLLSLPSRVVIFANGTVKEVLPGGATTISFPNGDIKRQLPDGATEYYYCQVMRQHPGSVVRVCTELYRQHRMTFLWHFSTACANALLPAAGVHLAHHTPGRC